MKNWNTDVKKFTSLTEKRQWELVQMINYGFDGTKVSEAELKSNWPAIRDILDPEKRRLFEYCLWGKRYSLPISNVFFWKQNEIKKLPIHST